MPDPSRPLDTTVQPAPWTITPLALDHKPAFDRALAAAGVSLSDYSFANNFCWQLGQRLFIASLADTLGLFGERDGVLSMQLPPLGAPWQQAAALEACVALLERANTGAVVGELRFVAPELVTRLREHGDGWLRGHTLEVVPESPDFFYRRSEMVELRGARYKSKRNDINQLLRTYPSARAEPLRQCDADAVALLARLWLSQRDGDHDHAHDEEAFALAAAMQHFDALNLFGVRLMIGDTLAGITLGERLPTGVVNVLFEKTDLDVPGASQFIFREFCRLLDDDALINTGDGAGSPSLVRAKESYRPVQLGEKFRLRIWHPAP
ncbi:DUF2156 domain-containing protein [Nannocystis punicea]|uniref:Phosphatidylglycerol lysyltransferase domain-containing protein n=1 Tax=Nannocystis punicea TaxID=2995304 RepID=A0ABY7H2Z4_9BACT|nr:phosphatidylglycerol lysyltransferase domain-containing protein [Nannocystis poenicansa]WAS93646.1 phosphatidylglycerol lysyltransferase domain-containing protein [Nannocystis poenicansa]